MRIKYILPIITALSLAACNGVPSNSKETQSQKAEQAAQSISYTENAEIENIKNRLELTSNPGQMGFILLLNESGQPIFYSGVKGKITSSGKRLTAPFEAVCCDGATHPAPSDEGTWGSSDPYIYFWTTDGQYVQWNGKYMYSDKPFRTTIQPLVIKGI